MNGEWPTVIMTMMYPSTACRLMVYFYVIPYMINVKFLFVWNQKIIVFVLFDI